MKTEALRILESLIHCRGKERRLTEFLKAPDDDSPSGWFIHVPRAFNDALDIRETPRVLNGKESCIWTQGSRFSFNAGDVLYNTTKASQEWSKALKEIKLCVQVKHAMAAAPAQSEIPREPGKVEFEVFIPNPEQTKLVSRGVRQITQDGFVHFLICGDAPYEDLFVK
jgi:hypothetical protein